MPLLNWPALRVLRMNYGRKKMLGLGRPYEEEKRLASGQYKVVAVNGQHSHVQHSMYTNITYILHTSFKASKRFPHWLLT